MKARQNSSEVRALLCRIHRLLDHYFDAMEENLQSKDYAFTQREQDARVFNALAQTLTRLSKLEEVIEDRSEQHGEIEIHERLEQRLAKLVKQSGARGVFEESE